MMFVGRKLDWDFDPLEALARWPADRRVLMLHSGRLDPRWSRWSILAEPVGTYQFVSSPEGDRSEWRQHETHLSAPTFRHAPFADLRQVIESREGLWIGHLSYDIGRWIEQLPPRVPDDRHWPIVELGHCPGYLVHDAVEHSWLACGAYETDREVELEAAACDATDYVAGEPVSVFSRDAYEAAVTKVLDYIAAGDVFQVNLAQRFTASLRGAYPRAHRTLFRRLAGVSPAWYGAYLELESQRVIASTSPELFLSVDESGFVTTRPIKGTRPSTVSADELRRSEKDAAELNMIVDLMRNDLGRVCSYGSVKVPEPRIIESHPTIHHGVATITGRLHQDKDTIDLLRATMPGGSVTGAPKVRAMQIIDELEPVRRGPYCGCIGLLSRDRTCLNIAIRTMLIDARRQEIDFSVGGGIVADSGAAAEYDETIDKAAAMLGALNAPSRQRELLKA